MKTTPKDFFLHAGATVALYVVAGSLINLMFSIINRAFPDALNNYFTVSSVAWPISVLIVLVPIFYVLEWFINRDTKDHPEKADLPIRKWRIYLTLFLAIAFIGGDLIALINTYLNGEMTARFIWKIVAILLVAGTIGKYYFFSIYQSFKWAGTIRKIHAWFGIILVIASVVGGFVIVGSPAKQRALRFDEQRVGDLNNIQWQIINYWQNTGRLVNTLADLNDSISGFIVPTDPVSKVSYEYLVTTNQTYSIKGPSFKLCANFDLPSTQDKSYRYISSDNDSWKHEAGKVCFDRVIDKERYPVNKLQ